MGARLAYLVYFWFYLLSVCTSYVVAVLLVLYFGLDLLSWILFG
jgi:hypothetical protein